MGCVNDSPYRYCTPPKRREGCHGACKEYTDYTGLTSTLKPRRDAKKKLRVRFSRKGPRNAR